MSDFKAMNALKSTSVDLRLCRRLAEKLTALPRWILGRTERAGRAGGRHGRKKGRGMGSGERKRGKERGEKRENGVGERCHRNISDVSLSTSIDSL